MSTEVGLAAEELAVNFLQKQGYKIIDRNWRSRWCEIDIVALCGEVIHFVEVKYRKNADFGTGLDYITVVKQRRLQRAAEAYSFSKRCEGPRQIDVVVITGQLANPQIDFLANITGD